MSLLLRSQKLRHIGLPLNVVLYALELRTLTEGEIAMDWVWTWGGKCFGYFDGDNLWTHSGKHVGRRSGDDIYGPDGRYLGEVRNDNRLITSNSKTSYRGSSFSPYASRAGYAKYADYAGYAMYAGYSDFPGPDSF